MKAFGMRGASDKKTDINMDYTCSNVIGSLLIDLPTEELVLGVQALVPVGNE